MRAFLALGSTRIMLFEEHVLEALRTVGSERGV
jgi:hypothetical protein